MKVKFWGTRGSLPQAVTHADLMLRINGLIKVAKSKRISSLDEFEKSLTSGELQHPLSYGGNTSCIEVSDEDSLCFVDMGSGFRDVGTFYLTKRVKEYHVFLTHMHWDHVLGLPFFIPVHTKDHKINIYHVHKNAPEYVKINFNGVNFPVLWDNLPSDVEFHQLKLYEPLNLKSLTVTPFVLDHPGGSFGYRFDSPTGSATVGVDGEYKRVSRGDLGKDLKYFQNLDLLVFDAQYEMTELVNRFDWGHSSPNIGVDLAVREGIRNLAFTHHDPWSDGEKLARMLTQAQEHRDRIMPDHKDIWSQLKQPHPELLMAYDGLSLDVTRPRSKK